MGYGPSGQSLCMLRNVGSPSQIYLQRRSIARRAELSTSHQRRFMSVFTRGSRVFLLSAHFLHRTEHNENTPAYLTLIYRAIWKPDSPRSISYTYINKHFPSCTHQLYTNTFIILCMWVWKKMPNQCVCPCSELCADSQTCGPESHRWICEIEFYTWCKTVPASPALCMM